MTMAIDKTRAENAVHQLNIFSGISLSNQILHRSIFLQHQYPIRWQHAVAIENMVGLNLSVQMDGLKIVNLPAFQNKAGVKITVC